MNRMIAAGVIAAGVLAATACSDSEGDGDGAPAGGSIVEPGTAPPEPARSSPTATTELGAAPASVPAVAYEACPGGHAPTLVAFAASDGMVRWTHCPDAPTTYAVLSVSDQALLVLDVDISSAAPPDLVSFDPLTGAERWRVALVDDMLPFVTGPFDAGGVAVVRVASAEGAPVVAAIDVVTGERRWELPADNVVPFANDTEVSVLTERSEVSGPAPPGRPRIWAIDRTTGQLVWEQVRHVSGDSLDPTAVAGSTLIVEGDPRPDCQAQCPVVGIDLATGAALWEAIPVNDGIGGFNHTGVRAAGEVVLADADIGGLGPKEIVALDPRTGAERWRVPGGRNYTGWAVDDTAFYLENDEHGLMTARELSDGSVRWQTPSIGELGAAGGGTVFAYGTSAEAPGEPAVLALSAADGTEVWHVPAPSINGSSPIAAAYHDATLYVSLSDFPPTD